MQGGSETVHAPLEVRARITGVIGFDLFYTSVSDCTHFRYLGIVPVP